MQDGRSGVNAVAERVRDTCIPIALNGHMLHWLSRTDGARGEFIRANRHPSGGNCFVVTTPGGRKLAGGNGSGGARQALEEGLASWERLPEAERKALPAGERFTPPEAELCAPPPGGLVLRQFIRNLKRGSGGALERIKKEDLADRSLYPDWNPIYIEPAHYHLWLTAAEAASLVPAEPRAGERGVCYDGFVFENSGANRRACESNEEILWQDEGLVRDFVSDDYCSGTLADLFSP